MKLDEEILSEVIKGVLKRDELDGADEETTMGIIDVIEDSIITYMVKYYIKKRK